MSLLILLFSLSLFVHDTLSCVCGESCACCTTEAFCEAAADYYSCAWAGDNFCYWVDPCDELSCGESTDCEDYSGFNSCECGDGEDSNTCGIVDSPTTYAPTNEPTTKPTSEPTKTDTPTSAPTDTDTPTEAPIDTDTPTEAPIDTDTPTEAPIDTDTPTEAPIDTDTPTEAPVTDRPTKAPTDTDTPTKAPTDTDTPTKEPTDTDTPTKAPTDTDTPTEAPIDTDTPTKAPIDTDTPTKAPADTDTPTEAPIDTDTPTKAPIDTDTPTKAPIDTDTPTEADTAVTPCPTDSKQGGSFPRPPPPGQRPTLSSAQKWEMLHPIYEGDNGELLWQIYYGRYSNEEPFDEFRDGQSWDVKDIAMILDNENIEWTEDPKGVNVDEERASDWMFAKVGGSEHHSSRKTKSHSHAWVWIFVVIFIGLFVYWYKYQRGEIKIKQLLGQHVPIENDELNGKSADTKPLLNDNANQNTYVF